MPARFNYPSLPGNPDSTQPKSALVNGGGDATYLNLGAFISGIIYFIIFMAVVYFLIIMPYKFVMAKRGRSCLATRLRPRPVQRGCPMT